MGKGRVDAAATAYVVAGVLCVLVCIGIYEAQVTIMFFDKSIDVTAFVLVTFLSSLLAPVLAWPLAPRPALRVVTFALALATVVAVDVRDEQVELWAAAAGCVTGMWWLSLVAGSQRASSLPAALPIALAAFLAFRAAARTMPLDEVPHWAAVPVALVIVVVLAWGAREVAPRAGRWMTTDTPGALALFALPFVFALAADVAFNGAVLAGAAGIASGPGGATSSYVGLLAAGAGVAAGMIVLRSNVAGGPLAAIAFVAGAALLWTRAGLAPLAGGAILAFALVLASAQLARAPRRAARLPLRPAIALGLGWTLSVTATLAYYLSVGSLVPLLVVLAVLTAAVALPRRALAADGRERVGARMSAACAAVAILAPLVTVLLTPPPVSVAPAAGLRVMTYNIHLGYDDGDVPAIDDIAAAIAVEHPDIVGLEEVTRGTVIAGGHDVLALLAERLGMTYVFAPMLGDIEGVGILARVPIDEVRVVRLARSTTAKDLSRALLLVRTGGLWFGATHLGGDDFRTQVGSIIEAVRGIDHVIVTGDLNSVPSSPQMRLFAEAGFTDLGAVAGAPTIPAGRPIDRIDYLWGAGVTATQVRTPETTASDHRPVVADVVMR